MKQLTLKSFTPCAGDSVTGNVPKHSLASAQQALSGHPSLSILYANEESRARLQQRRSCKTSSLPRVTTT